VILRNIAEFENTKEKILGVMAMQQSFDDTKGGNASIIDVPLMTEEREEPLETLRTNFDLTPSTNNVGNQSRSPSQHQRSSTKSAQRKSRVQKAVPSQSNPLLSVVESCNLNPSETSLLTPLHLKPYK